MRRALTSLLFLVFTACGSSGTALLCREDADCASGETCELVSGMCKPSAQPSRYAADLVAGSFGVSGAFDCPIIDPREPPKQRALGRATVVMAHALDDHRTCSGVTSGGVQGDAGGASPQLTGLRTGCVVMRDAARGVGPGATRAYLDLTFAQVDGAPDNPIAEVRFTLREDDAHAGAMEVAQVVHGRFVERCRGAAGATELELMAVADEGTFEIDAMEDGAMRGRFDVKLMMLEKSAERSFGDACDVHRDCEGGCALEELTSSQCSSGACVPERSDPSSGRGFCSASCDTDDDCDRATDAHNYCLHRPGDAKGQCVRLCDPGEGTAACPASQTCRAGSDFPEFLGSAGPARCLHECVPTPSAPEPPASCPRPTAPGRPDAGPRLDGGSACMPGDGGPMCPPPPGDGGPACAPGDGGPMCPPPPGDGGPQGPPPGDGGPLGPPPGDGGPLPGDGGPPPGDGGSMGPPPGDGGAQGPPPGDGGSMAPPPGDGGPPIDGGVMPPRDGGLPPPDAGAAPMDGGVMPPRDGGLPPPDAGAAPMDGGVLPPRDGGASDGGASSPLGVSCQSAAGCPAGWICASAHPMSGATSGFCTHACPSVGSDGACQQGYAGAGVPVCGVSVRELGSSTAILACAVACGASFGGSGQCPAPLACVDRVNNTTRLPPSDGANDLCVDP